MTPKHDQQPKATLASVARELGVSRTTVSNAYNRPDQLSPELRERILAAAQDLGYAGPDPAARLLRRGRAGVIGLLFMDSVAFAFRDPAATGFFEGLASATEDSGVGLLLIPNSFERGGEVSVVNDAVVDGFIVYAMPVGDPLVEAVRRRGLPTVAVESANRAEDAFVGIDDYAGARKIAEHVLGLGHRKIAVIAYALQTSIYRGRAGPERQSRIDWGSSAARLWGYRHTLEEAGFDWTNVPVEEAGPSRRDTGYSAARALLDAEPRPTAILAMSDQLAIGAIQAVSDVGLRVPGDVSVVGYDDIPGAEPAGLTTIRQPVFDKGRMAGEILLAFIERRSVPQRRVLLPTELIVRTSTGAPPN
jgi:DNA-binding LacI/PurR family transcriptional regulator